ncbi:VOC family protein [Halostreptopolyspora alba]|uniref:VOC family protein n=1 Tax=Halostreptopolyspora alba TaxID=2487137 RepID=A0A3N0E594_9ACTN|nr:VOC family protein [Nocardiopsaceae bacterium YIM 96095]
MTGAEAAPRLGAPIWTELLSSDIEAATGFYRGLFGWTTEVLGVELGGYRVFRKHGAAVAGAAPTTGACEDHPPAWGTYFAVRDVDTFAAMAREAGGSVTTGPVDILDLGRMAVLTDPCGAEFRVWQPGTTQGAELFNEPGALCWNELATRDPDSARRFYTRMFGWGVKEYPVGDATGSYTEWCIDSTPVGGLLPMAADHWPPDVPPHWTVYFAVADCDAAVGRAAELGGEVVVEPFDARPGRVAVVGDPTGARFSVIALDRDMALAG